MPRGCSVFDQPATHGFTCFMLRDRLSQVRGIGWGGQQVHGFHEALVVIQRYHHRVSPVPAADDRHICVVVDTIQQCFQCTAYFGIRHDLHGESSALLVLDMVKQRPVFRHQPSISNNTGCQRASSMRPIRLLRRALSTQRN